MANVKCAQLQIDWNWEKELYAVTGSVNFFFGGTEYRLAFEQLVQVPNEYVDVAEQIEHIFIDIAGRLGELSNAQLTLEADEVQTYI